MEVAGVDGCRGGWVIVWAQAERSLHVLGVSAAYDFKDVLAKTRNCAAVAVDIPIGLAENCARSADLEARQHLRSPRASSVFPAPVSSVLAATGYREACDISYAIWQKKLSKQTFALLNKIRDANQCMTPDLQSRVVEVHPEVCFWALNGRHPMLNSKRTNAGEFERIERLSTVFSDDLTTLAVPPRADKDDVLDACAAAWTAWRYATGQHGTLPDDPPIDSRGLRMEIVY